LIVLNSLNRLEKKKFQKKLYFVFVVLKGQNMSLKKLVRQPTLSGTKSDPKERMGILVDYGSKVEVDKSLAVKLYFRSGREMLRMANMYCDEGQLESAFILYYKFITLFVTKLPEHPSYKDAAAVEVNEIKKKLKTVFLLAEEIKSRLKKRYVEEEKIILAEQKRLAESRAAEEEIQRQVEDQRVQAIAEQERQDEEFARRLQDEEQASVREEMEAKYKQLKEKEQEKIRSEAEKSNGASALAPTMGGLSVQDHDSLTHDSSAPWSGDQVNLPPTDAPPAPPSYDQFMSASKAYPPQVPDRGLKGNLAVADSAPVPSVDRSTKPIDHHMSLGDFGGLCGGLRTVSVPQDLTERFLQAAQSNTDREAETMGILCGKMSQGTFQITNLFVPQQTGGHDSCDMHNEEELIVYQDTHNLITLGWIHTHPTQTAFLSSVDLHSHFPWQKMMPEAIAIVCSPKFNETGFFKLTEHGLDVIGSCRQSGFHPHQKDPPLFETCRHIELTSSENVVLTDKRR